MYNRPGHRPGRGGSCHRRLLGGHGEAAGSTDSRGHRRRGPGGRCAAVVRHVGLDKVTGREGSAQAELTGENGGGNDTGELASVLTGGSGVSSTDSQEIQHGSLAFEDGTSANGADLDGGHGYSNLKVAVVAG